MKLKAIALAAFVLGLAASFSLAVPQSGSGKVVVDSLPGTTTTASTTGTTTPITATTTTTTTTPTTTTTTPSTDLGTRAGTISALSTTSITVDGLTCSLGSGSPATGERKVGERVGIGCKGGVLAALYVFPSSPPATTTTGTTTTGTTTTGTTTPSPTPIVTQGGVVSSLGATSITVGELTCSIASAPANLGEFKVGDNVYIGCASGVLVKIVRVSPLSTTPHPETVTKEDSIVALSPNSITVGPVSCGVNSGSPSLSGFQIGDRVAIACVGGILSKIIALPALPTPTSHDGLVTGMYPPATPPSDNGFRTQLGSIGALSATSISVGPLTCSLGDGSPDLGSYRVGDVVGIGCANGVLFMIGKLPHSVPLTSNPSIKRALVARYKACVKAGVSARKDGGPTCRIADILRNRTKK